MMNANMQYQINVGHQLCSSSDVCKQHCYYQSKHVQLTFRKTFSVLPMYLARQSGQEKIINNKRITQNSCFTSGVTKKTQFINIILSLQSNGTSFKSIRLNFSASKT